MAIEVLPSIDLRGDQVVRLQQGDYQRQLTYSVDPQQTANSFREAGARWMHIVDLDGAKEGRPVQTDLIAKLIAESGLKVQVGGGVRSTEAAERLLECGAERVVIGTRAIEDWAWFKSLAGESRFTNRLVLALDAKDGMVATRGWTQTSGKRAVDIVREVSDWPLAAILYTDVARDGMMEGPNLEQTRELAQAGKTPVIASGGVANIRHIRLLKKLPIWGVVVGRSLYDQRLDLRQALRVTGA